MAIACYSYYAYYKWIVCYIIPVPVVIANTSWLACD